MGNKKLNKKQKVKKKVCMREWVCKKLCMCVKYTYSTNHIKAEAIITAVVPFTLSTV